MNLGRLIPYDDRPEIYYCVSQTKDRSPDIAMTGPRNKWDDLLETSPGGGGSGNQGTAGHARRALRAPSHGASSSYTARPRGFEAGSHLRWTILNFNNKVIYSDFIGVDGWTGRGRFEHGSLSAPHRSQGYNSLFGDGSVCWVDAEPLNAGREIDAAEPDWEHLNDYYELLDVLP